MYIKRSIRFILHTRKKGDSIHGKNLAIRMRIAYGGFTPPLDFPTGHNIDAQDWNAEKQRPKKGIKNRFGQSDIDINRTLDEYEAKAKEVFTRYELLEKRVPAPDEVKTLFNDMIGKETPITGKLKPKNFFEVFDLFTKTAGKENQWSEETFTKFSSLRKHIVNFSPNITFPKLDDDYLYSFIGYLQTKEAMQLNDKDAKHGMRNTTIAKNVGFIKWFLRWAAKKKYYNGNSHETFNPKLKGIGSGINEPVFLEWEELIHLLNFDFVNTTFYKKDDHGELILDENGDKIELDIQMEQRMALSRVRHVICFCSFTSLRHSDVHKLKRADVRKDSIRVVTKKTIDGLIIQLNKYSKAILEIYENESFPNDKALPVISNQKMNAQLKVMGQLVGIFQPCRVIYFIGKDRYEEVKPKWSLLTTHCGRRTFIINSMILGIPTEVVMKWTGHSDYESMKPYIRIVEQLKVKEMERFDNFDVHEIVHD